jgi:hypothetical protein
MICLACGERSRTRPDRTRFRMSSFTLVIEDRSNARLLRGLLGKEAGTAIRFFAASGRFSLATLARNILVHEGGPVIIVMDADTLDTSLAEGSCDLVETALRNVSPDDRFAVFAFVPELEVVFFEAPDVLLRKFGPEIVNSSIMARGRLQPKAALQEILQRAGTTQSSYLEGLTSEDFDELRQGEQASKFIAAVESLTVGVSR